MTWDKMKDSKKNDGGIFIKLQDGDAIEGAFVGEPYCFYAIFKDNTEYTERVEGSSFKFRVNFAQKNDDGSFTMKVYSGGATVRDSLVDLMDDFPLNDTLFKIKRTGSGKDDTRYAVLPKGALTEDDKATIENLDTLPLSYDKTDKEKQEDVPF